MPDVSVIMSVYNGANYIAQAIQSVLDQTYHNFELIIVDDGSTDNTSQIVSSFDNHSIRYIYQQNQGQSSARNTGIQIAQGKYICFIDHDDIFLKDKLQLQVTLLDTHPQVGLVYGWADVIDSSGHSTRDTLTATYEGDVLRTLLRHNFIRSPSLVMCRREVFDKVGIFDRQLPPCEDYDMWIRIAYAGYEVACVQSLITQYRVHTTNASSNIKKSISKDIEVLTKFYSNPSLEADIVAYKPVVYGYTYLIFALQCYRVSDRQQGLVYLQQASQFDRSLFQNLNELCQTIVHFIMHHTNDPDECETYLKSLLPDLKTVTDPKSDISRKLLGTLYGTLLFRYYERKDFKAVRHYFHKALLTDRSWLANRGFLSIGLRAALTSKS